MASDSTSYYDCESELNSTIASDTSSMDTCEFLETQSGTNQQLINGGQGHSDIISNRSLDPQSSDLLDGDSTITEDINGFNEQIEAQELRNQDTDKGVDTDVSDMDNEESYSTSPTPVEESLNDDDYELPETVTVLEAPYGGKVYLVGTAHFSESSQTDVELTIRKTKPNIVVLELCESRLSILSLDEKTVREESEKNLTISRVQKHIKEQGVVQGLMYLLLLSLSAHLTKELGMAPGGEFRRAFKEAKKVPGCAIHLGDRPVQITLRRAISSLSLWQKLRLASGILFCKETISKEEVERCKQKDLLEEMLAEMTGEFPALSDVFVAERDIYLTYSLQLAASPIPNLNAPQGFTPGRVVGIVGIGHVPGIIKNWGKVTDDDIPALLEMPKLSRTTVVFWNGVRYTTWGLIAWGCYRYLLPNPVAKMLSDIPKTAWNFVKNALPVKD